MIVVAVVLYYRNWPLIERTVQVALELSTVSSVVVIDNASGDGVAEVLRERYPEVEVCILPTNIGYAGGMNVGIGLAAKAGADAVLLMTHEVVTDDASVSGLLAVLSSEPAAAVVGPSLRDAARGTMFSWGGQLSRGRAEHFRSPQSPTDPYVVDWVDGACLLIRMAFLAETGLRFPEDYFLYCEEVEFAYRVAKHGGEVYIVPTAVATQSSDGMPPYYSGRNSPRLAYRTTGSLAPVVRVVLDQLREAAREFLKAKRTRAADRLVGVLHFFLGRDGPRKLTNT